MSRLLVVAVFLCTLAAEARERAVLIYPRERSIRKIFYTRHQQTLRKQLAAHYDLDVHNQIATEDQLFSIDVDGANLLVISGHGDPFAIYMAGRDQRTLDSTDKAKLKAFLGRLDENATIVLQSCHTGRGFAHLVKEAAGGRRVIAAKGEIPWNGVQITSVTPFDATILCGVGRQERWDCTLRLR